MESDCGAQPCLSRNGVALLTLSLLCLVPVCPQGISSVPSHSFFVDCSAPVGGDGAAAHPWNSLEIAEAHVFTPGDTIALARGSECKGSFSPKGSGAKDSLIRLTAYGEGPRPRIVASSTDRQALLLFNQEYWQVDSLDLSGGNTYGVFVSGDAGVLHHIYLKNLLVHDVFGGDMKNKDNGLVVVGPSKLGAYFDDVLIDDVHAAHTNQWAGILVGGGPFYIPNDAYINQHVIIRNSTVHDMYGDGIVLFRDAQSVIRASAAWETGMQPTQTIGTPNAIWTWTCTDCTVEDNEAFLTDSPGVDGGAYDIDWATTRNRVEQNYAHDTQGYCVAVFGAGYVTQDAVVRNNVCVNNGLSPRMSGTEGAVYFHTWDNGKIDGLTVEKNLIDWSPPTPGAPIVNDKGTMFGDPGAILRDNTVRSTSPILLRSSDDRLVLANNRYVYAGVEQPAWFWNGKSWDSLQKLQAAGAEKATTLSRTLGPSVAADRPMRFDTQSLQNLVGLDGRSLPEEQPADYRFVTSVDLRLDADGLIEPGAMARLNVLRTLAREYNAQQLQILVFVPETDTNAALRNALIDLDAPSICFVRSSRSETMATVLIDAQGEVREQWPEDYAPFNAATVGYAVRHHLGIPIYAQMDRRP